MWFNTLHKLENKKHTYKFKYKIHTYSKKSDKKIRRNMEYDTIFRTSRQTILHWEVKRETKKIKWKKGGKMYNFNIQNKTDNSTYYKIYKTDRKRRTNETIIHFLNYCRTAG